MEISLVLHTVAVIKFYFILHGAKLAILLHLNMESEKEREKDLIFIYPFASDLLYGQVPHEGVLGPQIEKN